MLKDSQVDLCGRTDFTRTAPLLARDEAFSFACAGCGGCCRGREDIVLSGFDLWRIAARLRLPPRTVARAFCRGSIGRVSRLPVLRLAPLKEERGNCPFLTENHCAIHDAEPLVCALYPLAQEITKDGQVSYFLQPTQCGGQVIAARVGDYLARYVVPAREATDVRWAQVCMELEDTVERLDALGMDWTNRNDRKWMSLYDVAAAYYHEHGNLNVPSEYVTSDGVLLGKWVARQRYAYLNPDRSSARVTPERKALLDKLGMVWEKYDPWQERYDLALAYKTEHGDLEIPSVYKTADGVWLGSWVNRQRQALNSGSSALSSERRKLLRTLFKGERRPSDPAADHGTVREANWERNFRSAARYARKYKHLLVPASYVDSDGVRLGVWISNLRAARKNRPDSYQVTPAHIKKLNSIGMVWDARDAKWGTAYQQAKAYYKAHGNLHAAANYKSDETGFCLGDWLRRMREWDITHDPKLTPERRAMLDKIGMEWSE